MSTRVDITSVQAKDILESIQADGGGVGADTVAEKQEQLVSGANIKTINGQSVLGSGDIEVGTGVSNRINVMNYGATGDGVTDDTNAIADAIDELTSGDVLYFPKGTYLITPPIVIDVANVTILGEDTAKIKTAETGLYNIMIQCQADNITFDNMTFDQMSDVAQLPTAGSDPPKGCHILHFASFQNATVKNCKFYGYGVTFVLTQPTNAYGSGTVLTENNFMQWSNRANQFYDVSLFNLDAMTVICRNNDAKVVHLTATKRYAETAYEIHAPRIIATGNRASDCIKHTLPLGYPMLHDTYDADTLHSWVISNNIGYNLAVGIDIWGANSAANVVVKNFIISNNAFALHATTGQAVVGGIRVSNGSVDASYIKNGVISNNVIEMTWDDDVNLDQTLGGNPTSSIYGGVGAISFNTSNSCEDIEVFGNVIKNFAGTGVNLICRQDHGTNKHKRINIHHNRFVNCGYSTYYDLVTKGLFVLDYCEDIVIADNIIDETGEIAVPLKGLASFKTNLDRIFFIRNNRSGYTNGFWYGIDQGSEIADVTSDDDLLIYSGSAIFDNAPRYLGSATPTGNYNVGQVHLIDAGIKRCTAKGTVRTISTVTGTWSNAKQVYVSPNTQIKAGDIVVFPGAQVAKVVMASGNYIYTKESLVTWSGGQTLTIQAPTFV